MYHYFLFPLIALLVLWRIVIVKLKTRQAVVGLFLAGVYLMAAIPPERSARWYVGHGMSFWDEILIGRSFHSSVLLVLCCFIIGILLGRESLPAGAYGLFMAPGQDDSSRSGTRGV